MALPMRDFYIYLPITIRRTPDLSEDSHLCVSTEPQKKRLFIYYVTMSGLIFFPLLIIVVWFYYEVAKMIWKHRKPANLRSVYQNEPGSATSTSQTSTKANLKAFLTKSRDLRTERKIRSFKIVLTITILFIVCRLPYVYIFLVRLTDNGQNPTLIRWEYYSLLGLHLLNCAMHPFLYAFLNEAITLFRQAKECLVELTCCCYDFDNFARENPFVTHEEMKAKYGERKEEDKQKY